MATGTSTVHRQDDAPTSGLTRCGLSPQGCALGTKMLGWLESGTFSADATFIELRVLGRNGGRCLIQTG